MEVDRVYSHKMELQCVYARNNHRNVEGAAVIHTCYCGGS